MTKNKRYRKIMGLIENTDGETFDNYFKTFDMEVEE